ncbi:MAG: hypothetical protein HC932_00020 [Thermales bacterium]|nr:hypothetical protein [Thermales bacterium]
MTKKNNYNVSDALDSFDFDGVKSVNQKTAQPVKEIKEVKKPLKKSMEEALEKKTQPKKKINHRYGYNQSKYPKWR